MTWRTKSILNYIVCIIFIVLTIMHIYGGESILRICADVVPAVWFGIIATLYLKRHYKIKNSNSIKEGNVYEKAK